MKTKVTGGIVTYNNENTIKECVQSIYDHTKDFDFQLYVYDNCSTDDTVHILKKYFPELILIEGDKNIGFGRGHNQIIKHVRSEYHAIINPDIYLENDVIQQMFQYMKEHSAVVQLTPEIRNLDGSIQYLPKIDPNIKFVILSKLAPFKHYRKIYTMEDQKIDEPIEVMSCTGCFSMAPTALLKKIHGYDCRYFMYFEDADLSRRLRKYGKLIYHPGMYVCHAWKRDNMKSMRGALIFLSSMLKYYRKWR